MPKIDRMKQATIKKERIHEMEKTQPIRGSCHFHCCFIKSEDFLQGHGPTKVILDAEFEPGTEHEGAQHG